MPLPQASDLQAQSYPGNNEYGVHVHDMECMEFDVEARFGFIEDLVNNLRLLVHEHASAADICKSQMHEERRAMKVELKRMEKCSTRSSRIYE